MKLSKHLREMGPEMVAKLQSGINGFIFGFATVGAEHTFGDGETVVFLGDFGKCYEAKQCQDDNGGPKAVKVRPYLNGHRKNGWAVWKVKDENPIYVRRQINGQMQKVEHGYCPTAA